MATTNIALIVMVALNTLLLGLMCRRRNLASSASKPSNQSSVIPFNELANALCDGYFDVDLGTGCYEVSKNWLDSTGYVKSDLPEQVTDMLTQIIHPDDIADLLNEISRLIEDKIPEKFIRDIRVKRADGQWRWMRGTAQVLFDNEGLPIRMLGSHMDISLVKANEQALHNGQILAGLRKCRYDAANQMIALGPRLVRGSEALLQDNWIYTPLQEISHPDDLPLVLHAIKQADEKNIALEIEFRVLTPRKTTRNIILYGEVTSDATGQFTGIEGVFRDITEQKRSESRYIQFGRLLEGSRTSLFISRISDLKLLFVNQRYCIDSGFTVEETVGRSTAEILRDWSEQQLHGLFNELKASQNESGRWFYESANMLRKDGSTYPVDAWTQVTEWDGETVVATLTRDVTERHDTQQALEDSEQKYRQLFDALPDGVALFTPDGTIVDCNLELATSHGWSREELLGQPISKLTDPDNAPQQTELIDALAKNDSFVSEGIDLHRDGSLLRLEAHAKAIKIQDEPFLVTVLRDASERHRYIRELQQQKADIEQFTYSISHDLKSPLITIEGFAEILAENLAQNEIAAARKNLQRITGSAARMHNLLTELLEYSRLGISPHNPAPTPLAEIVDEALERVAGQILDSGATITVQPDLPTVNGDAGRLAQVYQNLIDNAIKFSAGQTSIQINIGWNQQKNYFFVDDNGCGIDQQFHTKIFSLFDQLDPKKTGSGIGLAAVKRIIETHGGTVWVNSPSTLGGTEFCFTLKQQ